MTLRHLRSDENVPTASPSLTRPFGVRLLGAAGEERVARRPPPPQRLLRLEEGAAAAVTAVARFL